MQVLTDKQAMANIAANIKQLRGERSLSWLAREAKTYPANISRIESCESMPGGGLLARIAEALGTSVDALLSVDALKHDPKILSHAS